MSDVHMSHRQGDIQSHPRQATAQPAMANDFRPHSVRRHDWRERGSGDAAGVATHDAAHPVARVGIVGATSAGMAIATRLLDADMPVTVFDPARPSLDRATAALRSGYHDACVAGELTAMQRDRRVALLAGTVNLHHLKDCDVIVEVMGAGMDFASSLVRRLNEVARPDAILVTCGSQREVDHLAGIARCPANVLGLRASLDANAAGVWEFEPGKATSERALATAAALFQAPRIAPQPN